MNSVIQKVHSLVMFLIIAGMVWIGFFEKDKLQTKQETIVDEHQDLDEDVNSTVEQYRKFDLRLRGHGEHLQTMQNETDAHL